MTPESQLKALSDIAELLRANPDVNDKLNQGVFGVCNKLHIHPHDLAIYILIRTNSL